MIRIEKMAEKMFVLETVFGEITPNGDTEFIDSLRMIIRRIGSVLGTTGVDWTQPGKGDVEVAELGVQAAGIEIELNKVNAGYAHQLALLIKDDLLYRFAGGSHERWTKVNMCDFVIRSLKEAGSKRGAHMPDLEDSTSVAQAESW